ncbi:MAG: hypothetical protein VX792_15635 [Candidatus Latescibacterota bacterium]|nr:hypothetical protein [Candidatus Latescibacterota bacterium]
MESRLSGLQDCGKPRLKRVGGFARLDGIACLTFSTPVEARKVND